MIEFSHRIAKTRLAGLLFRAGVLFFLLAVAPSMAGATAVVIRPMENPVEILTSPTITLVAHGPQSHILYRVTLEIANTSGNDLVLAPPEEMLQMYRLPGGDYHFNRTPSEDGPVWVTWDANKDRRYPLRRIKRAYAFNSRTQALEMEISPKFERQLTIPRGSTVAVDLDFEITLEMPQKFSLHFDGLELGHNVAIEKVLEFPVAGGDVLAYQRQLVMARERALRAAAEAEAAAKQP